MIWQDLYGARGGLLPCWLLFCDDAWIHRKLQHMLLRWNGILFSGSICLKPGYIKQFVISLYDLLNVSQTENVLFFFFPWRAEGIVKKDDFWVSHHKGETSLIPRLTSVSLWKRTTRSLTQHLRFVDIRPFVMCVHCKGCKLDVVWP